MRTKIKAFVALLFLPDLLNGVIPAAPLDTAFTYQGRLNDGSVPASGTYELRFTIFNSASNGVVVAGPLVSPGVPVSNGLFTVQLDFGAGVFNGEARWLEIAVHTNDNISPFVTLSPRQPLTPAPYALHALSVTLSNGAVMSAHLADGSVTSVAINDSSILPVDLKVASFSTTFWKADGNAGTRAGTHFLGTTDNEPLELKVNGARALRLEPNASGAPNVVGGAAVNVVAPGVVGATIGGGGATNHSGFAFANRIEGSHGTISGGLGNAILTNLFCTIAGGQGNTAIYAGDSIGGGGFNIAIGGAATIAGGWMNEARGYISAIAGGQFNETAGNSTFVGAGANNKAHGDWSVVGGGTANRAAGTTSVIPGGSNNLIETNSDFATIGGGRHNTVEPNARYATIVGGATNTIQMDALAATIGGGTSNLVAGRNSTVGGGFFNRIESDAEVGTIAGGAGNLIEFSTRWTTIGGGAGNVVQPNSDAATIAGGFLNNIKGDAASATISGGALNVIRESSDRATIGGGSGNVIEALSATGTIGGGEENAIGPKAAAATISGGAHNTIGIQSFGAMIPGGESNSVAGSWAFAAGRRAQANHDGAFVWADDTNADFPSTTNKQFAVRANNGVMIQAANTALDLRGGGALRVQGAGLSSSTPVFIHRATAANISANITVINHPHCNNDPNAILIVTPNWNPGGAGGTYNNHPIGVYYNGTRWTIFNQDVAAMPVNAAFNVLVFKP